MGLVKCKLGFVWSLVLAIMLAVVPRYYDFEIESIPPLVPPPVKIPELQVVEGRIERNTTLVATLVDYDVPVAVANEMADLIKPVFDLRKLRFGNLFRLEKESDGTLRTFEYKIDDERILKVEKGTEAYAAKVEQLEFEKRSTVVTAEIQTSLWAALSSYPAGDYLTDELAKMFAWDIDFNTEVQAGDSIRLVLDEYYHNGEFVKYGPVRAAEFVNAGKTYNGFLFNDAYYDAKGNNLKRTWLASPLPFVRVTSGFTTRRMHPILGSVRAHLAVDYGAPSGTPVQAVANGTIMSAGWSGGYGRFVQIRHANGLTTGYAHLSRISAGLRPGAVVRQGQVIGAVGKTGLATGPHLHYIMTRGGKPIDPRSIKSEPPVPIQESLKAEFLQLVSARQLEMEVPRYAANAPQPLE